MSTIGVTAPARLLPESAAADDYAAHQRLFGELPAPSPGELIAELEAAGLTGRGGAGFPTATKWRAVRERAVARGTAVVVADGVETEPASFKDRTLLALRPHLVLDGLQLASAAVGADRAILYVSRGNDALIRGLNAALVQRRRVLPGELAVDLVTAPTRYVAGEETAVVARLSGNAARPRAVPPRPYEHGVQRRPTLVNNVETLAQAALIARHGAQWFRSAGTPASPGTFLVTVSGAVAAAGVREVTADMTVGAIVEAVGGPTGTPAAVLIGGYFGRWQSAERAWPLALDAGALAGPGVSLGAGVLAVLPKSACGVAESNRILAFLARESAGQCGPCHLGLPALADTFNAATMGRGSQATLARMARWVLEIRGRGACRHPDGATLFAASALEVFGAELRRHLRSGPCRETSRPPLLPTPVLPGGWR